MIDEDQITATQWFNNNLKRGLELTRELHGAYVIVYNRKPLNSKRWRDSHSNAEIDRGVLLWPEGQALPYLNAKGGKIRLILSDAWVYIDQLPMRWYDHTKEFNEALGECWAKYGDPWGFAYDRLFATN